jgi:aminoglycoside 3-N-acetyltransferase
MIIPELKDLFKNNNFCDGDIICVYSDITSFGIPKSVKQEVKRNGVSFLLNSYVDTFKNIVGNRGLLVMPTFSYSATVGEKYDIIKSKSKVGVLTNNFRKQKNVKRSLHPIFSFAAWGEGADELLNLESYDCFGEKSVFAKLNDLNVTYVLFGVDMQHGATFIYYSEQKLNVFYRYNKLFSSTICQNNSENKTTVKYFVRDLKLDYEDYWFDLEQKSIECGITKSFEFSKGRVYYMKSQDIDKLIHQEVKKDNYYLIRLKGS